MTYSYNDSGNVKTRLDSRQQPVTATMTYDGMNRMTAGAQMYARGYDLMGRVNSSTQTIGATPYGPIVYGYNLGGALTSFTFPSGRQQIIAYDSANRASGVTGTLSGNLTTYVSALTYWPNGAEQQITTGAAQAGRCSSIVRISDAAQIG